MADNFTTRENITSHDDVTLQTTYEDEFVRLQLSALGRTLTDKGVNNSLVYDESDGYVLLVPVYGPEKMSIAFSMVLDKEEHMTLTALYASPALTEPVITQLELSEYPDYDEVAENLVKPLLWDCFIWEHEKISQITQINNDNAEAFLDYLPDYFFGDEPYYACGISLRNRGRFIPCGAAVFCFTEKGLHIQNVLIEEECRGMGLGTYLLNYVFENFSEGEE